MPATRTNPPCVPVTIIQEWYDDKLDSYVRAVWDAMSIVVEKRSGFAADGTPVWEPFPKDESGRAHAAHLAANALYMVLVLKQEMKEVLPPPNPMYPPK